MLQIGQPQCVACIIRVSLPRRISYWFFHPIHSIDAMTRMTRTLGDDRGFRRQRRILPVELPDCKLPPSLPAPLSDLESLQRFKYDHILFGATIDRILFALTGYIRRRRLLRLFEYIVLGGVPTWPTVAPRIRRRLPRQSTRVERW
jgi:hypothetical protein